MDEEQSLRELAERRVGTVLGGKYTVDRVLGIGGMAVVYAATHRNQKQVAIKMLHPQVSHHPELRKRFLREGYVANSVKHKGAVDVIDDEVLEDGSAFIVMEYLDGAPVDVIAERNQERLPLPAAIAVAHELCTVLEAAHRREVVHRDVKPANVFVTRDGDLKVLDFGIARLKDPGSVHATNTGVMLGTPAFMSPEQARGDTNAIGPATDIWAVGAMLFKLLSGTYVHDAQNAQMLLIAVATKPPRSLASVAPELPRDIVDIVDRALQFDPNQRWASAAMMKTALMQVYLRLSALPMQHTLAGLLSAGAREPSGVSNLASTMPQVASSPAAAPYVVMPQAMTPPPRTVPTPAGMQPPHPALAPRTRAMEATDGPVSRSSFVSPVASKGSLAALAIGALLVVGGGGTFFALKSRDGGGAPASSGIVQITDAPKSAEPAKSAAAPSASEAPLAVATSAAPAASSAPSPGVGVSPRPNPNVVTKKSAVTPPPPPSTATAVTTPPPPPSTRPDPGSVR